ncbi:hypothetical protein ACJX0J_026861 [Zea mays]
MPDTLTVILLRKIHQPHNVSGAIRRRKICKLAAGDGKPDIRSIQIATKQTCCAGVIVLILAAILCTKGLPVAAIILQYIITVSSSDHVDAFAQRVFDQMQSKGLVGDSLDIQDATSTFWVQSPAGIWPSSPGLWKHRNLHPLNHNQLFCKNIMTYDCHVVVLLHTLTPVAKPGDGA